ncbi:hypothetical protein FA95DRAFT_1608044 [Auriscalpium vulgare]|uniref:Uncharacterized protein n=1 Tax=Auriscalpium vulgare TaxID=40419 RepID=A0ACB8RLT8_9AGAM|nr:hypothetical protein FA95DRAFT_1608044 [Auriscalpium vulgare]
MKLTFILTALAAALSANAGIPADFIPQRVPSTLTPLSDSWNCRGPGCLCDLNIPCCGQPYFTQGNVCVCGY